jgi:hypothetical protein
MGKRIPLRDERNSSLGSDEELWNEEGGNAVK